MIYQSLLQTLTDQSGCTENRAAATRHHGMAKSLVFLIPRPYR
jgi:hypothetical protein